LDQEIAECRTAIRLKPDHSISHSNLGGYLMMKGRLDEAITECRTAVRLDPERADAHNNLGAALGAQGRLNEATGELREAVRLKPDYAGAHFNLGKALRSQGEYTEAIAELRKARDLPKTDPGLAQQLERELAATERLASLAARLPAVLIGKVKPVDAAEMVGFAQLCYERKLQSASVHFWVEAFQAQPKLAEDMQVQNRYNAACAAALAGCGQGKDEPPLDEAARARWRKQAVDWLKTDLVFWTKQIETGAQQARDAVLQTLQHWKADTDLAGIRDPVALAKLLPEERGACQGLWAEVEALLRRAQTGQAQRSGPPARELPADVFAL
jgi:serine/threonine-protein kinase